MANQIIPGRDDTTTIVTDSYAVFGELQAGPPIPVEDSAKWQAAELDEPAVCRRYSVTPDVLTDWQARYNFPKPSRQTTIPGWNLRRTVVDNFFAVGMLDGWDESILDLATHVGKRAR